MGELGNVTESFGSPGRLDSRGRLPTARRKRIVFGLVQIAGGQAAGQLLNFTRNIIIARLLGPEQFGIGLTFAIIVTALEMAADFSWDKFLIQDREGDDRRTQSTCHLMLILRGIVLALMVAALSGVVARFFGVPQLGWAYLCLAVVPVLIGFGHTDVKRFHRELKYLPDVSATVSGDTAAFVAGIGAALLLGDFRAMLIAVLVRYAVIMLATHVLSDRRYAVGLSRETARRAWRFGWPLLLNGSLLFLASQGDRLLVGNVFGAKMLGVYGVATLVAFLSASFVTKALATIGLPLLSQSRSDEDAFRTAQRGLGIAYALAALCLSVPFLAFLPTLLPLLFGAAFTPPDGLVAWLVVTMALRIFQGWPVVTAVAVGETKTVLLCTLVRAIGFAFAAVAIAVSPDVVSLAIAFAASQLMATALVYWRVVRVHRAIDLSALGPSAVVGAAILVAFAGTYFGMNDGTAVSIAAAAAMMIVSVATVLMLCPQARSLIKDML